MAFFYLPPPTISCDTCPRPPRVSESQPFSFGVQFSTQLTDFFEIHKLLRVRASGYDVIHIHWSTFHRDFDFDIYERHILPARALTPALKFAPN